MAESLESITARLEELAAELQGELDEERAAELVREASELAAQAGREVEQALRAAAEAREAHMRDELAELKGAMRARTRENEALRAEAAAVKLRIAVRPLPRDLQCN